MGKLLKLKRWLTLPEAAKHLSEAAGEEVTVAHVLHFGLHKHLRLSVHFVNGCLVRPIAEIARNEFQYETLSAASGISSFTRATGGRFWVDQRGNFREERVQVFRPEEDLFDLPMIGFGRLAIARAYQQAIDGHSVGGGQVPGEVVLQSSDGKYFLLAERVRPPKDDSGRRFVVELHEEELFPTAETLPADSSLVVRPSAIDSFVQAIREEEKPAHMGHKERTNLLNLVGALLERIGGKEAAIINGISERHPGAPGLSKRTVEKRFAEAKRSLSSA